MIIQKKSKILFLTVPFVFIFFINGNSQLIKTADDLNFQNTTTTAVKIDNFSNVDFSKYNALNKANPKPKPVKDTSKNLLAINLVQHILDSIAKAKTIIPVFDCQKPEETKPLTLGSLNKIDNRVFEVTNSVGVDLTLFGVTGGLNKKDILIQANFFIYKDYTCNNSTTTRAIVGMTLYLHVSSLNISLTSKSLPNISAAVQLGKANASYQLQFYGLTQSIDFKDLPNIGDLNVDNYSKILTAWDKIKDSFTKDSPVDPVIIPNFKDIVPSE